LRSRDRLKDTGAMSSAPEALPRERREPRGTGVRARPAYRMGDGQRRHHSRT